MHPKHKIDNQLLIIIDDDVSIRDSLSLLFSQRGFNVLTFQSVERFLSSTSYWSACCAIIDLNLDRLTGIDALQIIKKERRPMKTILISAFGTPKFVREAFISDAFDYELTKLGKEFIIKNVDKEVITNDTTFTSNIAPKGYIKKIKLLQIKKPQR
jgi:two-component system response regulator DctR